MKVAASVRGLIILETLSHHNVHSRNALQISVGS